MNRKYLYEEEQFIRVNSHMTDRVLRAEFRQRFGWMPSFAGFRKKRQRLGVPHGPPISSFTKDKSPPKDVT